MGALVNLVQIGSFFSVYLDVNEQAVHDFGGGLILEGFMRHDMTPVAGRVTNR